jgi:hypothetical protein
MVATALTRPELPTWAAGVEIMLPKLESLLSG